MSLPRVLFTFNEVMTDSLIYNPRLVSFDLKTTNHKQESFIADINFPIEYTPGQWMKK
jgi:hypothetical protein